MSSDLKQTPLYQNYVDRGAKIVEFGGWAMPVQFSSIKEEHNAVRYEIGLFDVSHMGEIEVTGKDASQFVQYLLSNDTDNLTTSKALYTALCNEDVTEMKMFEFKQGVKLFGANVILSQSGYTGEDGFEIYCNIDDTEKIWDGLLEYNVMPCGLGARDTLRLEAGLPLHGQDLTESITPYEGGIAFASKPLIDADFIGKSVLKDQKENGAPRRTVGLELLEKGIARTGYEVMDLDGNIIGEVTSGTQSPSSGKSIALAMIKRDEFEMDRELLVQVRKRQFKAKIVKKNQIDK